MELTILLDDPNMRAQQTKTPFADALARLDTLTRSRLDGTQHAGTFPAALADFTGEHFARFDVPVESNTALMRALRELENLYGTFALTAQLTETEDSDRGCWIFTNGTEDVQRAFVDAMFEQASPGACVIVDEGAATPRSCTRSPAAAVSSGGSRSSTGTGSRPWCPRGHRLRDRGGPPPRTLPWPGCSSRFRASPGSGRKNEGDTKRLVQAAKAAGVPIVFDGDAEPDHPCSLAKGFCPVGYEADGWFGSMAGRGVRRARGRHAGSEDEVPLGRHPRGDEPEPEPAVEQRARRRRPAPEPGRALHRRGHRGPRPRPGRGPAPPPGWVRRRLPAAGYATAAPADWLVLDPTAYQVDGFTLLTGRSGSACASPRHPSFVTLKRGARMPCVREGVRPSRTPPDALQRPERHAVRAGEIPSWTVTQEITVHRPDGQGHEYVDIASATGRMLADHSRSFSPGRAWTSLRGVLDLSRIDCLTSSSGSRARRHVLGAGVPRENRRPEGPRCCRERPRSHRSRSPSEGRTSWSALRATGPRLTRSARGGRRRRSRPPRVSPDNMAERLAPHGRPLPPPLSEGSR